MKKIYPTFEEAMEAKNAYPNHEHEIDGQIVDVFVMPADQDERWAMINSYESQYELRTQICDEDSIDFATKGFALTGAYYNMGTLMFLPIED